jgi:hypothetical protein
MMDPKRTSPDAHPPSKEPYQKPEIAWEEPLAERPNLMAACAQRPAEDPPCISEPFS